MARIHNDEWLHLAKGTPVNGQRRLRHGNERTEALTVGNLPDRYWCYCNRCKTGAVEMKAHVMVGGDAPRESKNMTMPTDVRPLGELLPFERDALALLLSRKSMDFMYFGDTPIMFSASRQRLIIHTPSGAMGRDTTERSDQKWLTYDRQHYLKPRTASTNVLLVEDTFSYYKVQYVLDANGIDATVLCTLGTAIHDAAFLYLLHNAKRVFSFYDGDAAGYRGCNANMKRLYAARIYGRGDHIECAPPGLDPKDMNIDAIAAHVNGLLAT